MSHFLKTLIEPIYSFIRGMASFIVPKKKGYYAFFPKLYGDVFTGNVKAFMLYVAKNHKEIDTVLLAFEKGIIRGGQAYGLKTKGSVFGIIWASLRAEHIFIDASTSGNFKWGRFSLIQLWHGSGFKEVGLLRYPPPRKRLKSISKKYNIVVATSESEAEKLNASFATNSSIVSGSPRNDVFFKNNDHFDDLKIKYNLEHFNKVITYAPTFRDAEPIPPFSENFYQKLQDFLEEKNALFIVKKHPSDKFLKIPDNFKNIKDLSIEFADVQELLLITDVLITDYSSIATDFALTKKPILIYPYDLEQYIKTCRSMYYDIEEILPQPFIKNENDLLEKLKDESWTKTPKAIESYENFINIFHKYLDGNSSKRVMEAIQKLQK